MAKLDIAVSPRPIVSTEILSGAAACWFAVALAGQWLFVFYIVGLYGRLTLKGGLPAWAETHLPNGYIAGDPVGNAVMAGHVLLAVIVHGAGPLQLVPQIRDRFPAFHRWNGRVFLTVCVSTSVAGLYLTWARAPGFGGLNGQVTITIVALLIFAFAAQTIRHAVKRDIETHHRWALRLFLLASAVWFARLVMYGGIFVSGKLGIEFDAIRGALIFSSQIGQFLIPLVVLEIYLRAQRSGRPPAHYAAAGLLILSTFITGVALYGVATLAWLPRAGL